ncbi:MAG: flagellar basal-body rod protein FlgG [Bacteroidetes bacterium]|nr:flagellar basal-body rod protein FlgG [Bacteroidota bacterium]MCL5027286.1 flagellar basal-body rod protein FlgG [Chloroflexota bacterium]
MTTILKVAASGLLAQQANLDLIANNIANLGTTGFKKSRAVFADAAYETGVLEAPGTNEAPMEVTTGTGVTLAAAQRILSPGSFRETGNVWDLTIAGDGFFQVSLADGRTAYTRDGSFQVDAQGQLVTADGSLVTPPVTIPQGAQDVEIDGAGTVRAKVDGKLTELGAVNVATFPNPAGLLAVGHNLFVPSDASGEAQAGAGGTEGRGQLMSGVLEGSNVDFAEETTKMIEAQRAYQLSIKLVQTADEMLGLANNIRK